MGHSGPDGATGPAGQDCTPGSDGPDGIMGNKVQMRLAMKTVVKHKNLYRSAMPVITYVTSSKIISEDYRICLRINVRSECVDNGTS